MEDDDVLSLSPDSYSTERIRETRADRIKNGLNAPDFTPTRLQTIKDVLSESVMQLSDAEREDILRTTGVYASTGQQVSTAIENALIGMNQLGDELTISFGNVANYITGGAMGKELQDIAYDSMTRRYERMAINEDAIGGIRSELAQLAGGATSFLQLALEGLATGGYLSLAHIGAQSFGEGTYNDMKAYADKHDGSIEGYKPQGVDLAINTANAIMQVATEEILGVGRVGFIKSAALRGGIKEGLGGFVQEAAQDALADLAEAMKGNEEYGILLDNIDQYVRDGIIGGVLQGPLGAASYHHYHAKATNTLSGTIAKARGHETPTAEDQQQAEDIVSANERGYASAFVKEFKAAFDASTGEGQLQANIAKAINDAIKAKELDLGIDDETKRAQKVEQIATQETLNAMEQANEQGKSISEMGINNIVYKDGAIWVEGMAPELGERAVEYARVLAERQTGLAEVQMKLDGIKQEIQQTKKELAEAKAQSKQALADKLQARLEKQNALAEKRRVQAEKLKVQTEKIQKQIAKELREAPKTVEEPKEPAAPMAKVAERSKKYKGEKKSLKEERATKTPEQQFLSQSGLDNGQNGTTITGQGGGNARAGQKAKTKEIVNSIRRRMRGRPDTSVWVDTSTGDSGVKQTPGIRSVNLSQADQKALNDQGVSTPNFTVYSDAKAGAQEFLTAMQNAVAEQGDQAASVDVKELSDYEDMQTLILSEDKKTGCAITKDGEIVSLFSSSEERGRTIPMLLLAVQNGGTKMVYDPNNVAEYNRGDGKLIKSGDVDADYGLGMQAQDEVLAELALQETQAQQNTMMAAFRPNQMLRQEETTSDTGLKQSKVEGTGSDKYRGGYDEQLKRIVLGDKSDLTTIQHEFAHYWIQNNFKWARSGLASPEWLRKWRDVEEALGIEPHDRFLSKQASEKFARAYERFIMEGKYNEDLKWAFDGFKEFYDETYEDLKNEYFDLSEELDPAIVDWFNRQRPTTEKALKEQAYKKVATVAMAQGAEIVDKVDDNTYTISSMNKDGEIETEVFVSDDTTKDSKLVEYSGKKKERRMVKGLQEINKEINPDMYKAVNNAGTVENARNWVESDYNGAWQALNDQNTALIDRTALYQAFKSYAEDGHPEVAVDLAQIKLTKEMTELGQAMSILSERAEFDPMNIIDMAQKALGEPSVADTEEETADMHVEQEQIVMTEEQANELKNQTECKL